MVASACEIFHCERCSHRKKGQCVGCAKGNVGMVADGTDPCAIWRCVASKGITSCKECTSVVCPFSRSPEMVCPVRDHYEKKRCYTKKLSEYFSERRSDADTVPTRESSKISDKCIVRLRWYLFALDDFLSNGITRVSSNDISRKVGVKAYLIRHDLSQFGGFGRPSIGYDVAFLRSSLAEVLHVDDVQDLIWVGSTTLIEDEQRLKRFEDHGYKFAAVFDTDRSRIGKKAAGMEILPFSRVSDVVSSLRIRGAVLAVSPREAQAVADDLAVAGIKGILNVTSAIIVVPPSVCLRNVDLVAELFALSYYCQGMHE